MLLKLMIFAVAALACPIEMASSEEFEKELTFLKMKIENMDKNEHGLKVKMEKMESKIEKMESKIEKMESKIEKMESKIEKMESNEEKMKENMVKMRNKISDMKKNECDMEKKMTNSKARKENKNKDKELKSSKKGPINNPDKTKNIEDQNVLDTKISGHEFDNDCCDILNITVTHLNERVNDNTRKIIENQLEIQNNKKDIDTNINNIDRNANNINVNAEHIHTNENNINANADHIHSNENDLMKRSDYCAYQWLWNKENQVITYEKLILENNYNIPGAKMDINKGEFTAGLSAIYQIDVSIRMVVSGHQIIRVFLRRNGVNMNESIMHSSDAYDDHDDLGGRYIIMKLDAGDTVSVFAQELAGNLYDITFCINVLK